MQDGQGQANGGTGTRGVRCDGVSAEAHGERHYRHEQQWDHAHGTATRRGVVAACRYSSVTECESVTQRA